jgi:hypothetical protein
MPPAQQYDPNNPTPYQAPELPAITPPPQSQATQEPAQIQRGPMNNLGGFAQLGNSMFKGYMQGKADKTVKDAITFKKQDDNLQTAYNMAAQNLKQMHDSGTDPNSDEYKQALSAVQGTWQGLMTFRGQHLPGDEGGGKKGKKSKDGGDQNNPIAMLSSDDPTQKMRGAYAVMMKLGPPVLHQLGDPKQAAQRRETADLAAGNELADQKRQKEVNDLAAIPAAQRTPEQNARYTELTTKPVQPRPGDEELKAKDAIFKKVEDGKDISTDERKLIGLDPKSKVEVTKTGEIVALNSDGTYKTLRSSQEEYEPKTKTVAGTKIPKAVQDKIISQKNDAIAAARQQFLYGQEDATDPKKAKIGFDEYIDRWQQAQDKYEERIETMTGEPVTHVDVRSNVDEHGNWKGPKTSEAQGGETLGVPNNLGGGKPSAGESTHGQEELGLPPELAKQLKPGFISTLSDGSRWTMKDGKPFQVSVGKQ